MSDNEGLTRPLVNNVGGMIDQDAPSADQVQERRNDAVPDSQPLGDDDTVAHAGGKRDVVLDLTDAFKTLPADD